MTGVAVIVVAGLGIYAIRASFLLAGAGARLGERSARLLDHARPALLGALVAGALRAPGATWTPDPRALVVVGVAILAARRGGTAAAVPAGLAAIALMGVLA